MIAQRCHIFRFEIAWSHARHLAVTDVAKGNRNVVLVKSHFVSGKTSDLLHMTRENVMIDENWIADKRKSCIFWGAIVQHA